MYRILNTKPTPLETLVPGLDPELPRIIERAMLKEPDLRYQDLEHLREDFAALRNRLVGADLAPAPGGDADTAATPAGSAGGTPPPAPMAVRRSRGRALAGVARDSSPFRQEMPASSAGTYAPGSAGEPTVPTSAAPRHTGRLVLGRRSGGRADRDSGRGVLQNMRHRIGLRPRPAATRHRRRLSRQSARRRRRRTRRMRPRIAARIGGRSTSASARSAPPRGARSQRVSVRSCSTR